MIRVPDRAGMPDRTCIRFPAKGGPFKWTGRQRTRLEAGKGGGAVAARLPRHRSEHQVGGRQRGGAGQHNREVSRLVAIQVGQHVHVRSHQLPAQLAPTFETVPALPAIPLRQLRRRMLSSACMAIEESTAC